MTSEGFSEVLLTAAAKLHEHKQRSIDALLLRTKTGAARQRMGKEQVVRHALKELHAKQEIEHDRHHVASAAEALREIRDGVAHLFHHKTDSGGAKDKAGAGSGTVTLQPLEHKTGSARCLESLSKVVPNNERDESHIKAGAGAGTTAGDG